MSRNFPKLKIPISLQISIFLVIIAFIPVIVMMALNTYEKQQLELFESLNVQQGRIVASSLNSFGMTEENARLIIKNLNGQNVSRIRVLDSEGKLMADSARLSIKKEDFPESASVSRKDEVSSNESEKPKVEAQKTFIYRLFSLPIRVYRKLLRRPTLYATADFYNEKTVYDGEEIQTALKGSYGAVTRFSSGDQPGVTLYSAIPVINSESNVTGVVLVSRSTYRILRNLYELRRDLALVFLKSLIAVVVIAIFFAFRISVPLKRLSKETTDCADKKGRIFFTKFTGRKRLDEVGELSRSFSSLIERLNKRIQFSQAFSSDISHEFKNPLTAIRSSAELLGDNDLEEEDRKELSNAIIDEVNHLQMLLTGVRNISRIDAGEELNADPIAVIPFLKNVISRVEKKYDSKELCITLSGSLPEDASITVPEDYFDRVAENLIDNAASFGSEVLVTPEFRENNFILTVEDNGKGVNPDAFEKVFNRFYSERDENQKSNHTGLGLSTVKAITDALEGDVSVSNSESLKGAKFTVKINDVK
ncbi:MAG: ATP-binding protein [Treponema sp.]|uniref:HAMP domain-containing sensor histidine kinase n=1 Tax=Treponema sp. TaxID=166 RepID=UPI00298DF122|nr:HAMP domain-containing sensor histidine kinase [Treponema sp.]MCQ2599914.1 ATP-binding protein [Treponema sp.]